MQTRHNSLPMLLQDLESFFNDSWMVDTFKDIDKLYKMANVTSFPPCNISTDKDGTAKFEFALAGYKEENLDINIQDDKLIITASNPEGEEDKEDSFRYLHHGIRARNFKAVYPLGNKFDTPKAEASFNGGMLTITIPVAEEKKPRSVKINLGN